jgi:hypothetical protein
MAALHFVSHNFGACWVAGLVLAAVAVAVLHYELRARR